MSDGTGIIQHAIFNVPNLQEGYCTDDNARAFILCNLLDELGGRPPEENLESLATSYLRSSHAAMNRETGRFRNFMSHGRQWLEDRAARTAMPGRSGPLGTGAGRSRNEGHRKLSAQLFERGAQAVEAFPRPAPGPSPCWASTSTCAASRSIRR